MPLTLHSLDFLTNCPSFTWGHKDHTLHREASHHASALKTKRGLALDGCLCPSEQTIRTAPLRNANPSARASTSRSLHRVGTWEFKTQMNLEAEPPNFWEGKYESASRVDLPSTTRGSSTTNHFFQSAQLGWLVPGFAKVSAVIE